MTPEDASRARPVLVTIQKRPGYRLHRPDSAEAEALLAERGLTRADLERALERLARAEGVHVRTIVGLNEDGVFGSGREGWRSDLPGACDAPFVPLLWLKLLELLGPGAAGQHGALRPGRDTAGLNNPAPRYAAAATRPAVIS